MGKGALKRFEALRRRGSGFDSRLQGLGRWNRTGMQA